MTYYLLTGATGLLGTYLLRYLLPRDVPLAVLIRGNRTATARQRMETVICELEDQLGYALPRPVLLSGDLCSPGLGLSGEDRAWLARNARGVLHNAASLTFEKAAPHEEPWLTNLHGTKNLLELTRELGIRDFHHVSTAYVSGLRNGRILESELDLGQEMANDYERSKLQAELLVRDASWLDCRTVYRPGTIVGDSQTGFTNSYHGFYTPLRIAHMLINSVSLENLEPGSMVDVLGLDGTERKNLVPVDWVAAVIGQLFHDPAHHGEVYHITPEQTTPVSLMREVMESAVRQHSIQWQSIATPLAGGDRISVPDFLAIFRERMQVYQSHWRDDPQFDATNRLRHAEHLPCPILDREMLMRICRFAIEANFWSSRGSRITPSLAVADHFADVPRHDLRSNQASAEEIVQLRVLGPGGDELTVRLKDGVPEACEAGVRSSTHLTVTLATGTLQAILEGRGTWRGGIEQGRIVVENCSLRTDELESMLAGVFSSRRLTPSIGRRQPAAV